MHLEYYWLPWEQEASNTDSFQYLSLRKPFRLVQEIELTKEDHEVFPEEFVGEHDLFRKFYENIIRTRLINRYTDEVIAHFQNSTECELNLIEDPFRGVINEPVPSANKSKKIKLQDGKGYVAKYDIKEGEEIFIEKAAFLCKYPNCNCNNHITYECYHCSKSILNLYQCKSCCLVVFCSDKCCHIATEKYHKWECYGTKFHFFKKGDTMQLALRMMFVKMMSKLKKPPLKITQQEMKVLELPSMLENASTDFLKMALKKIAFILIYLLEKTSYFEWLLTKVMLKTSIRDTYVEVGGFLLKYACLAARYSITFQEENQCLIYNCKGMTFSCPSFTYSLTKFQHSCQPNAVVITRRNYITIKAGMDIERGTEITISHIGLDFFESHRDRKSALSSKMINCNCPLCTLDINVEYDNIIYKCELCKGRLLRLWPKWKCFDCKNNFEPHQLESRRIEYLEEMKKFEDASKIRNISEEPVTFLRNNLRFPYFPSERYFDVVLKIFTYYLSQRRFEDAMYHQENLYRYLYELGNNYKYSYVRLNVIMCIHYTTQAYTEVIGGPYPKFMTILSRGIVEFKQYEDFFGLNP